MIYGILGAGALLRSVCLGYVYSKYHADVLLGAADLWDRKQQQPSAQQEPAPARTRLAARSWIDTVALRVNGSFLVPAALPSEFKVCYTVATAQTKSTPPRLQPRLRASLSLPPLMSRRAWRWWVPCGWPASFTFWKALPPFSLVRAH